MRRRFAALASLAAMPLSALRTLVLALLALTLLAACDVHEWPKEEYGEVEFVLNLDFDTDLPLYREITYTRGKQSVSWESLYQCDVRYIISVCPAGTRKESRRFVFTRPYEGVLDYSTPLPLPEGEWDIYVWADYVAQGSTADKYYATADFSSIVYADPEGYTGSTDCREAFRGSVRVSVTHPYRYLDDEALPDYSATVDMVRPMGRYEFIATDVDDFLTRVAALRTRGGEQGDTRVDVGDFTVVFRYNAFMPCSFNMFTDKPSDSWTGMSYSSRMTLTDDGMLLGFDYVMVNGSETMMNINVEVYDKDGTLLSVTRGIEVPIVRSKLTIIRGDFLTSSAQGGVSINPGYEGDDFNIELP